MFSKIKCTLFLYFTFCYITTRALTTQRLEVDTNLIGVPVKDFSPVMKDVIKLLVSKDDSLGITLVEGKSQLMFRKYTGQKELTGIIEVPNDHFKSVFAQSRNKYQNMYPNYWIAEIGFASEADASKEWEEINNIITGSDVFNRNTKDYIIKNKATLIYLKIALDPLEQQAMDILEFIKKRIKADK